MSQSPRVSRRRVLGALATVGGASAAAGAGTMALFSDMESSSGNIVQAGTLDLSVGGTGTFGFTATLAPTESTSGSVTLASNGTFAGSLDIDVEYTETDASGGYPPDMTRQQVAQNIEVTSLSYGGTDLTGQINTSNTPPTLHDLATNAHGGSESTQNDLINLADPGSGTEFSITFRLKDVSDDFQGDGLTVDFIFHLNQTDGQ